MQVGMAHAPARQSARLWRKDWGRFNTRQGRRFASRQHRRGLRRAWAAIDKAQ